MAQSLDLKAVCDEFVAIAYDAGATMLAANPGSLQTDTKLNSVDIVTEADKAVEHMVSTRLSAAFPSVAFMGEETYKPGMRLGPEPTFVVDPIDGHALTLHGKQGTTNFVHSFPNACISLGLAIDRRPVVGVIYNPWQHLLFTAIHGCGAFMKRGSVSHRLPLSATSSAPNRPLAGLGSALVGVEWGSDRSGPNFDIKTDVFRNLATTTDKGGAMVHSLRSMGSAALNLAAVAAGQMDLYWEGGCWAWDVCAGWCILEEAGGIMVGGNPSIWHPALDDRVYLAVRGAPSGQKEIVQQFWAIIGNRELNYTT